MIDSTDSSLNLNTASYFLTFFLVSASMLELSTSPLPVLMGLSLGSASSRFLTKLVRSSEGVGRVPRVRESTASISSSWRALVHSLTLFPAPAVPRPVVSRRPRWLWAEVRGVTLLGL